MSKPERTKMSKYRTFLFRNAAKRHQRFKSNGAQRRRSETRQEKEGGVGSNTLSQRHCVVVHQWLKKTKRVWTQHTIPLKSRFSLQISPKTQRHRVHNMHWLCQKLARRTLRLICILTKAHITNVKARILVDTTAAPASGDDDDVHKAKLSADLRETLLADATWISCGRQVLQSKQCVSGAHSWWQRQRRRRRGGVERVPLAFLAVAGRLSCTPAIVYWRRIADPHPHTFTYRG